jgi:hypothetical protein
LAGSRAQRVVGRFIRLVAVAVVFATPLVACGDTLAPRAAGASVGVRARAETVAIPVLGRDYVVAYARLYAAGLKASIREGLTFGALLQPTLGRSSPSPGVKVRRGSVVTLHSGCCSGLGSPAVPNGPLPAYVVPSFVGTRADRAAAWVRGKTVYFEAHLGRLRAGGAASLFANYRVTRQDPAAGTAIKLGVSATSPGGFLPTPLAIWATQTSK